uniref:Secreted protein n=1 Tax=Cannabis sativa TaxID=3483 RepID=A0A803PMV1_CANSA
MPICPRSVVVLFRFGLLSVVRSILVPISSCPTCGPESVLLSIVAEQKSRKRDIDLKVFEYCDDPCKLANEASVLCWITEKCARIFVEF